MNFNEAMKTVFANKAGRDYPGVNDPRSRNGAVFPAHRPKFRVDLDGGKSVFSIGSCFARNIEEALLHRDVFLPTRTFSVPAEEWSSRPSALLNEYNPGTISQRILFALDGKTFPSETIVPTGERHADLLLHGPSDVKLDRALERRLQVDRVYEYLSKSQVVIITLGYIEAWYDRETNLFLNRMPPHDFAVKNADRFLFRRLDVSECLQLLEPALNRLGESGIKTIVTVSPVPLQTTFTSSDCVVANEFSKSVLRVCAERLRASPMVDYFPSYEIVRIAGLAGLRPDQVHVKYELTREIAAYMLASYGNSTAVE